jgi:hypothetical protein
LVVEKDNQKVDLKVDLMAALKVLVMVVHSDALKVVL